MKKKVFLILIVFIALTACAPKAVNSTAVEAPKPSEYTNLEATVFIGNYWQGACGDSWMIFVQASDSGSVTLLEGNPNVSLVAIPRKAPGAFFSGCKFIRVVPNEQAGNGDWKVKIYGLP
ncbi:MAG: hypothetical protein HYV90_05610 [Candidatus Woesebacteria bacterium]|nr:MAG: hypothetical protein HYV90_05610 [Candidatus Woesebacteria bacterium]